MMDNSDDENQHQLQINNDLHDDVSTNSSSTYNLSNNTTSTGTLSDNVRRSSESEDNLYIGSESSSFDEQILFNMSNDVIFNDTQIENSHQSWMQNSRNDYSEINSSLQRTNSSNQNWQN